MKERILITSGTTVFAQRMAKYFPTFDVVFAANDSISSFLLHTGKYFYLPSADDSTYIHELLKLALDKQIDVILPLGLAEAEILSGSKTLFEEYGVAVLVSEPSYIQQTPYLLDPPRALSLFIAGLESADLKDTPTVEAGLGGVLSQNDDGEIYQCFAG